MAEKFITFLIYCFMAHLNYSKRSRDLIIELVWPKNSSEENLFCLHDGRLINKRDSYI